MDNYQLAMTKWDRRYLDLAQLVSTWSKDPRTQVGAVIVSPFNRVVSVGYNGFPKGFNDEAGYQQGRDYKLSHTIHAELNAILQAGRQLDGYKLYLYPIPPCSHCLAMIRQAGICNIVVYVPEDKRETFDRWDCQGSIALASTLGIVTQVFYEKDFSKEGN